MQRPYIICHMLTSLDGKTAGDFLAADKSLPGIAAYETINARFQAQACLSGRISMEENFTLFQAPQFDAHAERYPREDYIALDNAPYYMVVIDTSGKLAWQTNSLDYMDRPAAHIVEVLTQKVSDEYISYLRARNISYIIAGEQRLDLPQALDKLSRYFGIKTLVLSGGGRSNGYFLAENLIDELSIIIVPTLSADDNAMTLFNAVGHLSPAIAGSFALKNIEKLDGDGIWLQYRNQR